MTNQLGPRQWAAAETAMAAFAVAPHRLGGLWLHCAPGPVRSIYLDLVNEYLPGSGYRKIPLHIQESRLLGGIDLTRTLAAGTVHWQQGLLEESHDGVVLLAMAERASRQVIAHLSSALDAGQLIVAREGLNRTIPAAFGVIALDEGAEGEAPEQALTERLGLRVDLTEVSIHDATSCAIDPQDVVSARDTWQQVSLPESLLETLVATSLALGIHSPRAVILASRLTKILAALDHQTVADESHVTAAVTLSLAHRATHLPELAQEDIEDEQTPPPEQSTEPEESDPSSKTDLSPPTNALIEAALAHMPAGLLASLGRGSLSRGKSSMGGKSGARQRHKQRGRPVGSQPGDPRRGERLNLMATLRAAAPWQGLRQREASNGQPRGLRVKPSDFRVTRFRYQRESTTIFVVDASGSAAMHRMAEAKGAVELLLADCYSRRDHVALIAFRGEQAELLLPPTRSLVRAKRALAALPGGGGTPLAHAIELTTLLSGQVLREGATPTAVFLTDGVANIALDGSSGRQGATEDALAAAKRFQAQGCRALIIDASPRAQPRARELATALGGDYLLMPRAEASSLRNIVSPLSGAAVNA